MYNIEPFNSSEFINTHLISRKADNVTEAMTSSFPPVQESTSSQPGANTEAFSRTSRPEYRFSDGQVSSARKLRRIQRRILFECIDGNRLKRKTGNHNRSGSDSSLQSGQTESSADEVNSMI